MTIFFIIDVIVSIMMIIFLYLDMKYEDDDDDDGIYNPNKLSSSEYVGCFIISLIPALNMAVAILVILAWIYFSLAEVLENFRTKNKIKLKSKKEIEKKYMKNLIKALITAGYFKDTQEIDDFIEAYSVSEKLSM